MAGQPANDFEALMTGVAPVGAMPVRAVPVVNEYDSYIAETPQAARMAAHATAGDDPEAIGKANVLGRQTGLPSELVDADPAAARALVRTQQASAAIDASPRLADWAANPRNAAVAHDDYPVLGKIGSLFDTVGNVISNIGGSLAAGVAGVNQGIYGAARLAVDARDPFNYAIDLITGTDSTKPRQPLIDFLKRQSTASGAYADAMRPKDQGFVARNLYAGVESLPVTAAALATAFAGAPVAGAALFGVTQGGQSYTQARDVGVGVLPAATFAAAQGAIEVATELPEYRFATAALGKLGIGHFLTGFFGRELLGEEVATVLQGFNDAAVLHPGQAPGQSFSDYAKSLPENMAATALSVVATAGAAGTLHGGVRVIDKAVTAVAQARTTQRDAQFLDDLANGVDGSATRKRDATAFEAFLQAQADGTPVEKLYVPAEKVRELYQSERFVPGAADDTLFGFQGDIAEQLAQALPNGGDIVFDTAKAMTHLPGTPVWDAIKPDVRVRADGLSLRDVADHEAAFGDAMLASGEAAAADYVKARSDAAPQQQVYDDVHAQAKAAGFGTNAARAYADLFAARYQARGAALGVDAMTAYKASNVTIESSLPASVQPYVKADGLDMLINAMQRKSGDGQSEGQTLAEFVAKRGGVTDPGGDLASMGANDWHKEKKFRRKLIRDAVPNADPSLPGVPASAKTGDGIGYGIDDVAEAAWEEGYFPSHVERPTAAEFMALMREDLHGGNVRRLDMQDNSTTTAVRAAADDLSAMLQARGVDSATATAAEIKAAIAQHEADGRTLDQNERASIMLAPGANVITLFENRDLSSLLHEGGHLWLEELKFDATSDGANDQLRADYAAVQAWFADNGHAVGADGIIPTEAHELFARGIERYLMEGKSPASGLSRAFASFRSWLLRIYQVTKNLGSPITDEVRGVMDRLLATQSEIDAALADGNQKLLFKTAADAGMTDAEFAAYTASVEDVRTEAMNALLFRTMETVRRARTVEYREQRDAMRVDVAKDIGNRAVFRAIDLLRNRDKNVRVALNRQAIIDQFGADALKLVPGGVPPTVSDTGLHPDVVAEMVGLPTGAQLIDELAGVQIRTNALKAAGDKRSARDEAIDIETDARMAERHGDPLTDGSIEEEARAAIHNDVRSTQIASEARALARKVGALPTPYRMASNWAERQVRGAPVRDAVSASALQRHQRAENKAADLAVKALAEGNADEAFKQKQAQMFSNALYRAAKAAKDDVEAAAKRLSKLGVAKTLKSMDQDYLDQIHGLLEAYDFKTRTGPAIDEREAFAKWAAARDELGETVVVPPRLLDADAVNYKSMTTDDLLALDDTVQSIAHLGRRKKRLLVANEERDFDETVRAAEDAAAGVPDRKFSNERNPSTTTMRARMARANAAIIKIETYADDLDNGDPNGPFNRILVQGATLAANEKAVLHDSVMVPLTRLYLDMAKDQRKRMNDRVTVPEFANRETNEPMVYRRSELLAVALNTGNESNLDKMLRGEGWNAGQVDAVLTRELNADDWKFIEKVWRQVDSLWPHIARVERELTGLVPEKIEARKVQTPFGEIEGGYYPVAFDPARSDIAAAGYEDDAARMFGQMGRVVSTPKGHTKERTNAAAPLMLSLEGVLVNHVNRVTTRLAYGRYARDALKFISDPRIRKLIDNKLGPDALAQMKPWLQRQVNDASMDTAAIKGIENLLRQARINATIMGLGFRVTTMAAQVAGWNNSIGQIGPKWFAHGLAETVRNMGENRSFVFERSDEMRHRAQEFDAGVRDAFAQMRGDRTAIQTAQAISMWGIGAVDVNLVAIPTWIGAYHKGLTEGMSDNDAAMYGDKAVRLSQGSGRAKDLSAVQGSNEFVKMGTMFYSYFNVLYNKQFETVRAVQRGDYRKAANTTLWIMMAGPLLGAVLTGDLPQPDEDYAEWAVRKIFFGLWAGVPWVRDMANFAERKVSKQFATTPTLPVWKAGDAVYKLGADAVALAKGDEVSDRWIEHMLAVPGYLYGLPGGTVGAAAQYAYDVSQGKQRPKGAGDVVVGIAKGPQKTQE